MNNLVLHDPVNLLPTFTKQMGQFFRNPFMGFDNGLTATAHGPAVTVYETADEYVFQAELPGWSREQVSINFENQTLTIGGRRELQNGDGRQYHRVEGLYGQFARSFTVPGTVDAARVEAALKDGVLTIRLPKREEAKPRQIEVKTVQ
jgi:HSP20 family protein